MDSIEFTENYNLLVKRCNSPLAMAGVLASFASRWLTKHFEKCEVYLSPAVVKTVAECKNEQDVIKKKSICKFWGKRFEHRIFLTDTMVSCLLSFIK